MTARQKNDAVVYFTLPKRGLLIAKTGSRCLSISYITIIPGLFKHLHYFGYWEFSDLFSKQSLPREHYVVRMSVAGLCSAANFIILRLHFQRSKIGKTQSTYSPCQCCYQMRVCNHKSSIPLYFLNKNASISNCPPPQLSSLFVNFNTLWNGLKCIFRNKSNEIAYIVMVVT